MFQHVSILSYGKPKAVSDHLCKSLFLYSANLCFLNNKEANNYTKPHSLESDSDLPREYQSNAQDGPSLLPKSVPTPKRPNRLERQRFHFQSSIKSTKKTEAGKRKVLFSSIVCYRPTVRSKQAQHVITRWYPALRCGMLVILAVAYRKSFTADKHSKSMLFTM